MGGLQMTHLFSKDAVSADAGWMDSGTKAGEIGEFYIFFL